MNRVLLDQGLAPRAAALLRSQGWEFARQRGMACVTLDHDFHTHLALSLAGSPSVVFVRVEGLSAPGQAELIKAVWDVCGEAIAHGAAVSTDGVAVRVHRLPLA